MLSTERTPAAAAAALIMTFALAWAAMPTHAQPLVSAVSDGRLVRIEARFVDRAGGQGAPWGATGQILVPGAPVRPAVARWGEGGAQVILPMGSRLFRPLASGYH